MSRSGAPIYEHEIQRIWAEQDFDSSGLKTVDGKKIEVFSPGWWNQGQGPDFEAARLSIGDDFFYGSVEVHLQSSGWKAHGHNRNPAYDQVILHVVLYHQPRHGVFNTLENQIPELELAPHLKALKPQSQKQSKERLKRIEQLPGRCGVWIRENDPLLLKNLLGHAAEQRMQNKMRQLHQKWQDQESEELLFQLIFKSLGYSVNAAAFEELARLYPYSNLRKLLRTTPRESKTKVLSRWFGASGILSSKSLPRNPELRRDLLQWSAEWKNLDSKARLIQPLSGSTRPGNAPERRLVGMYYHLARTAEQGLIKSWLTLLSQVSQRENDEPLRHIVLELSQEFFETPDWDAWSMHYVKSNRKSELIGMDRKVIIWANAILPFFLAYARKEQDMQLEQLLFRIFMVLPPEASNQKTRFMERRLWTSSYRHLKLNSFGYRQGMLQVHADFCRNFFQGCADCELLELLQAQAG